MPELPEVETVKRQLDKKLIGKTIESVEVLSEKQVGLDEFYETRLIGKTFDLIERIGKLLIFSFSGEADLFILGHLKMTGQIIYEDSIGMTSGGGHTLTENDAELPNRHTRIIFNLDDGTTLYFNDLRKFGYMKLATKSEVAKAKSNYGPEPIDPNFDCEHFYQVIHKSAMPIKPLLLDQKRFAGLGNIYVDEALFRAGVLPSRPANKVTKVESLKLCQATGQVMRESIELGGTTFMNFTDTGGESGNFKDKLQVFGKQGTPCPRCSGEITKIKLRGRGTHFCPNCQK